MLHELIHHIALTWHCVLVPVHTIHRSGVRIVGIDRIWNWR
ncbi:MAG TPA: hypothetical protein VGH11_13475 [Jatrophihabitans sp.]|jgi:hypothetical protein